MCPPVFCPACAQFTFHKGRCENVMCGYNPREKSEKPLEGSVNYAVMLRHLTYIPSLQIRAYEKPFPRLSVVSTSLRDLERAVEQTLALRFEEGHPPIWTRRVAGPHGNERWYGFDFTHARAKPFVAVAGEYHLIHPPALEPTPASAAQDTFF